MKLNAPKSIPTGGGDTKYLDQPGTYHLSLKKVAEDEDSQGNVKEGAISFCGEVLAGTTEDCVGREVNITLFGEAATEKGTEICERAQLAFCFATNILRPADFGGSDVEVDAESAVNAQIVAKLDLQDVKGADGKWHKPGDGDKRFLKVSFDNIFHVDDPKVEAMPKDSDAIALIDKSNRYAAEVFERLREAAKQEPAVSNKAMEEALDF